MKVTKKVRCRGSLEFARGDESSEEFRLFSVARIAMRDGASCRAATASFRVGLLVLVAFLAQPPSHALSFFDCPIEEGICGAMVGHWELRYKAARLIDEEGWTLARSVHVEECNQWGYRAMWLLVSGEGEGGLLTAQVGKPVVLRKLSRAKVEAIVEQLENFDLVKLSDHVQDPPFEDGAPILASVCEEGRIRTATFNGWSTSESVDGCGVLCELIEWAWEL
ncbi:hypothetical protein ABI59_10690 [Acidobacteria bacterium Mor1]|nr:hypothetical protein ABI59_10690 [Acidobacteria bacterium Mor1]